jgi:AraC family transcriptional activator of tynA and feaB
MGFCELLQPAFGDAAVNVSALRSCLKTHMMDGLDIICDGEIGQASVQTFDFAGARLWHMSAMPLEAVRRSVVNRGRPVAVAILQLAGESRLRQDGRECSLEPGGFAYVDVAKPLLLKHLSDFDQIYLQFPQNAFPAAAFRAATVIQMRDQSPVDRPFFECIKNLWEAAPMMHPIHHSAALSALLSLSKLTSAFVVAQPEMNVSVRVRRAMDFIEHHLGDTRLNAQLVAERQSVSRRYLDELFSRGGYRIEAWIWERRLARAAQELSCPDSSDRTLLQIALDLGFKTPSHFSRAFSNRFGVSPRDYRKGNSGSAEVACTASLAA